jgi:hypothetical protein
MSTSHDHLGERCFQEQPVCLDAEVIPVDRHAPVLAFCLSAAFAAAAFGFLLAVS